MRLDSRPLVNLGSPTPTQPQNGGHMGQPVLEPELPVQALSRHRAIDRGALVPSGCHGTSSFAAIMVGIRAGGDMWAWSNAPRVRSGASWLREGGLTEGKEWTGQEGPSSQEGGGRSPSRNGWITNRSIVATPERAPAR